MILFGKNISVDRRGINSWIKENKLILIVLFFISVIPALNYSFTVKQKIGGDYNYPFGVNFAIGYLLSIFVSIITCIIIKSIERGISNKIDIVSPNKGFSGKVFCIYLLLTLIICGICFAGAYPGYSSYDTFHQYNQCISNSYNDWHPFLHTLVFIKIPLLLGNGNYSAIVIFQIIIFSLVMAYCMSVIWMSAGKKISILAFLVIILNPSVTYLVLFPWKDSAFAISGMLMVAAAIHIIQKGKKVAVPCLLFVISSVFTTILRHNGILFTFPFFMGITIFLCREKNKKKNVSLAVSIIAGVIVLFTLIKGPLYKGFDVQKSKTAPIELLGMPMTIIGNAVSKNPDKMDDDVREFALLVASEEKWDNYYVCGNFNSIKLTQYINSEEINNHNPMEVVVYMFKTIKTNPYDSLEALFSLTNMTLAFTGDVSWDIRPEYEDNNYGIEAEGVEWIEACKKIYNDLASVFITKYLFFYTGICNLICIILIMISLKSFEFSKFFIAASPLLYNLGTTVLLSGNNFRFFVLDFMGMPLIIVLLCVMKKLIKS